MRKNIALDFEFNAITNKNVRETMNGLWKEIVQIGAVMMDEEMNIISEFHCFVKPRSGSVSKKCTRITQITDEDVKEADFFEVCLEKFLEWVGDISEVFIYSWSDCDLAQLKEECESKNVLNEQLTRLCENWIDFQKEFEDRLGYSWQLSLENAVAAMNLKFDGRQHDALSDARNTAYLIQLANDPEEFDKKTSSIQFFFKKKEDAYPTLGEFFPKDFKLCP